MRSYLLKLKRYTVLLYRGPLAWTTFAWGQIRLRQLGYVTKVNSNSCIGYITTLFGQARVR